MTQLYQVTDTRTARDIRTALCALSEAIKDSWTTTLHQVGEEGYDERVALTAFGQFLHHNVMNRVYGLNGKCPGLATDLVPNDRRSAYHVTATIHDLFITISSVSSVESRPRYAQFRTDYAQSYFTIDHDNHFQPTPVVDPGDHTYVQILHGPREDSRHRLGFILVVFPTSFGQYRHLPMGIDDFLDRALPEQQSDVEKIEDSLYPDLINDQGESHAI